MSIFLAHNHKMLKSAGRYIGWALDPKVIRSYTLRFEFSNPAYNPTTEDGWKTNYDNKPQWKSGITWTRVYGAATNQWDCTYPYSNWTELFKDMFEWYDEPETEVRVIDGNTTGVTNMSGLFSGCSAIKSCVPLDTSAVTAMDYMFSGCSRLTEVPMLDTSNVTNMTCMLIYTKITSCPLYDTSKVFTMSTMFRQCTNLVTIPQFNTPSLQYTSYMFEGCSSLTSIPIIDTSKVTNAYKMFEGCTALQTVPLLSTSRMTEVGRMFYGCENVESGALALYQRMSGQSTPPSHDSTFYNCGSNTVTGAAELAQIPSSWK